MRVDPIADEFAWVSVYNYAENSPIANIDLHGLQAFSAIRGIDNTLRVAPTRGTSHREPLSININNDPYLQLSSTSNAYQNITNLASDLDFEGMTTAIRSDSPFISGGHGDPNNFLTPVPDAGFIFQLNPGDIQVNTVQPIASDPAYLPNVAKTATVNMTFTTATQAPSNYNSGPGLSIPYYSVTGALTPMSTDIINSQVSNI